MDFDKRVGWNKRGGWKTFIELINALLYGYSLIIARNFVTVYTAFDY